MEINIINDTMVKLNNEKDGLNMIISRQGISDNLIATSYYQSNHQICYQFSVKQVPNDILTRVIQSPAQKFTSIFKRTKGDLSLEYYYHHSLDMIRGFFASKKYKNSDWAKLSKRVFVSELKDIENVYNRKLTDVHSKIRSLRAPLVKNNEAVYHKN